MCQPSSTVNEIVASTTEPRAPRTGAASATRTSSVAGGGGAGAPPSVPVCAGDGAGAAARTAAAATSTAIRRRTAAAGGTGRVIGLLGLRAAGLALRPGRLAREARRRQLAERDQVLHRRQRAQPGEDGLEVVVGEVAVEQVRHRRLERSLA